MKKILLLLFPLALLAGCSRQEAPLADALYHHYAARQDMTVAQVGGFRLGNTVRVDVVMLQAEEEQSWLQLTEEFNIRGEEGMVSWLGDIDNPALRTKWTGDPVMRVIALPDKRTIGFYRIETEAQYDALIDYQLKKN